MQLNSPGGSTMQWGTGWDLLSLRISLVLHEVSFTHNLKKTNDATHKLHTSYTQDILIIHDNPIAPYGTFSNVLFISLLTKNI